MENEIEKAKRILKANGYFVDSLWCVADVKHIYPDKTDEECQEVLDFALTNEATIEQIQFSIKEFKNL